LRRVAYSPGFRAARGAERKLWVGYQVVTTVMTGWLSKEYGGMTVDWHMRAQRV